MPDQVRHDEEGSRGAAFSIGTPDLIRGPPALTCGLGARSGGLHDGERLPRNALYGVTSQLLQRIHQHRDGTFGGFTAQYGCKRLVWFEMHGTMDSAIAREKRLKRWRRAWKLALVSEANSTWRDLGEDFGFEPIVEPKKMAPIE